jgi:hypothetical protein
MDTAKIKQAIERALTLLKRDIETEITQETKSEYRYVILQLENSLKEFDQQ